MGILPKCGAHMGLLVFRDRVVYPCMPLDLGSYGAISFSRSGGLSTNGLHFECHIAHAKEVRVQPEKFGSEKVT